MIATSRILAVAFAAVILLLSSAGWAQVISNPPPTPPPPPDPPRTCGIGKGDLSCPANTRADFYTPFGCEIGCNTSILYCQNPTTAPAADIQCEGSEGGFVCYGSPQSETGDLTYTWSGYNVIIDQPDGNLDPYASVDCRRLTTTANLVLTVTAHKTGVSKTVSKALNCLL